MARPQRENVISSELPRTPWVAERVPDGALIRVLSEDDETGAMTALVDIPAGWERPWRGYNQAEQEFFVLEGTLRIGDDLLTDGCYCYYPAGVVQGTWRAEENCCVFAIFDRRPAFTRSDQWAEGAREDQKIPCLNSWIMEWDDPRRVSDPTIPFRAGIFAKMLRVDEETGATTLLAGFAPGWFAEGIEVHPIREEGFLVSGDVHIGEVAGSKGYTLTKGGYFTRPAGIPHGPLATKNGNVTLVHTEGRLGINYQTNPNAERLIMDHLKNFPWI